MAHAGTAHEKAEGHDDRRRVERYPLPPKDADLVSASPAERLKYGFPALPGLGSLPALRSFWERMLARPLIFPEQPEILTESGPPSQTETPLLGYWAHLFTSLNWSGASLDATLGQTFMDVRGAWTVPTVTPTADDPHTEHRSSAWIGIDGQRIYLNSTLPQLGTEHFVGVDSQGHAIKTYRAFVQWWALGQTFKPQPLLTPVKPDDRVLASLTVFGNNEWVLFNFRNETTGIMEPPFAWQAPLVNMPTGPTPVQTRVTGATVEWVTERPSRFPPEVGMYPLADYDSIRYEECRATQIGPDGSSTERDLLTAYYLDMVDRKAEPNRTVLLSDAKRGDPASFTTHFKTD